MTEELGVKFWAGVKTICEVVLVSVTVKAPPTCTCGPPLGVMNTAKLSFPVSVVTEAGLIGLSMLMGMVLFSATPVAPPGGTIDVTDGCVVSAEEEELVVNALWKVGIEFPSISRRPL